VGKMGEGWESVDPVAKHEICGPKQQNLTRSNKCKKNWYGYFCGDFRNWDKTKQNQARKWGVGTPRCESTWLMIPRCCRVETLRVDLFTLGV
jgi:hypothetical protein